MNKLNLHLLYDQQHPLIFSSALFLLLFLIFYSIYVFWGVENKALASKLRNAYILLFSLYIYYMAGGWYVILLILSILINYTLSEGMDRNQSSSGRKSYLVFAVVLNLLVLGYYKYTNFFIDNANMLSDAGFSFQKIFLPIGISFYTFQIISYHIDLYRKEIKQVNNVVDFALFVAYFPQLVAGPIVRAKDFIPQMYRPIKLNNKDFSMALFLILFGLIKKSVISDYISVNFVDRIFDNPLSYSPIENLLASYGYAMQIYCDFSGYSDMAIGLALLMGFNLPINFRTPYQSASITEFWRRWHISLSTWLKDYLYISMGGNRKGKIRTYINLILTMLIGGLWHGASWRLIVWGGLHGVLLAIERFMKQYIQLPKHWIFRIIGVLFTFHFVVFCWIFFRANSFESAWSIVQHIGKVRFVPAQWLEVLVGYKYVFILLGTAFILHFSPQRLSLFVQKNLEKSPWYIKSLVIALVFYLVYLTASSGFQPFIYFQY